MRFEGKLEHWNEERGFGSIEVNATRERLFVHISAFERGRVRPPLGTLLEFDVARDAQGRKRAVEVRLPGDSFVPQRPGPPLARRPYARAPLHRRTRAWAIVAMACVVVAMGAGQWRRINPVVEPAGSAREAFIDEAATPRRCDGRTRCTQMTSCAEATWFLKNCPGTEMDGNHDGVPCEQQWCR